jgi:hypothetical protein
LLMETKNELEDMINKNEDMGMDNLLRWLLDRVQSQLWTARWFLDEDYEEEEKEDEETQKDKKLKKLFNIK